MINIPSVPIWDMSMHFQTSLITVKASAHHPDPPNLTSGWIKWPPSCIFHENLILHLFIFHFYIFGILGSLSFTYDEELKFPRIPQFMRVKVPYATWLVRKWLTIEIQFIRIDNLHKSRKLLDEWCVWKVWKLSSQSNLGTKMTKCADEATTVPCRLLLIPSCDSCWIWMFCCSQRCHFT